MTMVISNTKSNQGFCTEERKFWWNCHKFTKDQSKQIISIIIECIIYKQQILPSKIVLGKLYTCCSTVFVYVIIIFVNVIGLLVWWSYFPHC